MMKVKRNNDPIDVVLPWVNGNDLKWQHEKNQYSLGISQHENSTSARFRDMGTLRYLFRSLERNAPWVNKIHFVTYNQIPEWMNLDHPKINIVDHKDFIPEEYLPTFSSRTIEFNYHRIPGISNNLVCFNDDMFVIKETQESDFFVNNLPCDAPCMCYMPVFSTKFMAPIINIFVINRHFDKKQVIREHPLKWYSPKYGKEMLRNMALSPSTRFTGFINAHIPFSIKADTLRELWTYETDTLSAACKHRFRDELDVNIWLAMYWQYAKNEFIPRNPNIGSYIGLNNDLQKNETALRKALDSKAKLMCLNDELDSDEEFEAASAMVTRYLESLFPEKSAFEL